MAEYPSAIVIRCLHCGPVATADAAVIRGTLDIVRALAQGHAPLGAITCPLCRDEVRAKDVQAGEDAALVALDAQVRR